MVTIERPQRPRRDYVHAPEMVTIALPSGATRTAFMFAEPDMRAILRNDLEQRGYIGRLEAAPFWAEPAPDPDEKPRGNCR